MKRNFWIAFVAMMLMMVMVFGCVGCSNNNSTQNDNSNVEQTTPDINNNEPNGSENSDQNNGSNDVENNVNNGNETTEPDVNGDVNNGTNDDNNGNTDNNTGNNDNSDSGSTGDDSNTNNDNFSTDNLVGLGLYVFPTNETPIYSDGAVIKGVEATLNDGTVMFTFGQFQAMYFINASFDEEFDGWTMDTRYSSNLVYCGKRLAQRPNGTFSSYMEATYVDMTGRDLSYYIGRIYEDNNQYFLMVDATQEDFMPGMTTIAETVNFYANDVLVEMEVYFAMDVEMFDGLYNAYEFIFYNSSGTVVNTVKFDVNSIPSELVWENNYFRAEIQYKYNNEVLFEKEIMSNDVYFSSGFVCDTVIDGIGYHHNIPWVMNTEN